MRKVLVTWAIGAAALAAGCRKDTDANKAAGAQAAAGPAQAAAMPPTLAGTVLEATDAASYTYLRLKTADGELWAAVPKATVAVGSQVSILAPMKMDGFESKTLGRKFDRIVFGTLSDQPADATARAAAQMAAAAGGAGASPHGAMPGGAPGAAPSDAMGAMIAGAPHGAAAAAEVAVAKVDKAAGPEGRTVAEVWAGRADLKDKPVTVRGQVVKFSSGIMGRNWMHLRDGSGAKEAGDNDLTVTTDGTAAVGDVVTVSGTVRVDQDFGAGYSYKVLVDGAKVTK